MCHGVWLSFGAARARVVSSWLQKQNYPNIVSKIVRQNTDVLACYLELCEIMSYVLEIIFAVFYAKKK